VARVKEGFGGGHVASILRGEVGERTARLGHDKLSTFGLMRTAPKTQIRDWIQQLIRQKLLDQAGTEYPILKLNAASWEVMKSQRAVVLTKSTKRPRGEKKVQPSPFTDPPDGELFAQLRRLRMVIAREIAKPPYIIFTDDVLRNLVRARPTNPEEMRRVSGVGELKLKQYGSRFLEVIRAFASDSTIS
jgi:ATP-dependent DNA helicase RecQ